MTITTAEGREVYPVDSPIRQAIPDKAMCKTCRHLGDLCRSVDRTFGKINNDTQRVVVYCNGWIKHN